MCANSTYYSQKDLSCYQKRFFPSLQGFSSVTGTLNVTIDGCTDANCAACVANNSICTQCNSGYNLNVLDGCSPPCSANCAVCSSITACTLCSTGYTLNGGLCIVSSNNSSNSTTGKSGGGSGTATAVRNTLAVTLGVVIGVALGFGIPLVVGGIITVLNKLGVFKKLFKPKTQLVK